MDQIHHIRALYYEQGYNISEIAKATGRDWKTVAKYIDKTDFNEPLPVPESEKQFCPKLEPYKALSSMSVEGSFPESTLYCRSHGAMPHMFSCSTARTPSVCLKDSAVSSGTSAACPVRYGSTTPRQW